MQPQFTLVVTFAIYELVNLELTLEIDVNYCLLHVVKFSFLHLEWWIRFFSISKLIVRMNMTIMKQLWLARRLLLVEHPSS